jgi:hypothetical protein
VAKKISDPVKKSIPKAVTEYIDRIGAAEINFRSYQVKEFKGKYYFEKAYIKINPRRYSDRAGGLSAHKGGSRSNPEGVD